MLNGKLSKTQLVQLEELSYTEYFDSLIGNMEDEEAKWIAALEHPAAENHVPEPWVAAGDLA